MEYANNQNAPKSCSLNNEKESYCRGGKQSAEFKKRQELCEQKEENGDRKKPATNVQEKSVGWKKYFRLGRLNAALEAFHLKN